MAARDPKMCRSAATHGAGALLAALLLTACGAETPPDGRPDVPIFEDVTDRVGLDFHHFNGMSGELYFAEMMGAGGALFDYDGDGDLDLYLVQGEMLGPGKSLDQASFPPRAPLPLSDRLYRNELDPERGPASLRFTDVTRESGIAPGGYGMGVATGDVDNDGRTDLYVTSFGGNRLLRNAGDGTFADITARSNADDPRWSVGASFVDLDRDGWLDLYIANYVDFTIARHRPCYAPTSARDYCTPLAYRPEADRLLRNRGDGTFDDVSAAAGILDSPGNGLGVIAVDVDGDGWQDLYVANDQMPNRLWMNRRDGTFSDEALLSGAAVNAEGASEASMGVDAADVDGDGDQDLFLTHLAGETNTLYRNGGGGWFDDASQASGLALPSLAYTGFGAVFLDFDNDGRLDLATVNGDVRAIERLVRAGDPFPLHQPNQLFLNLGGRFEEITARGGVALAPSEVSRGAIAGDVDNDGDLDLVVTNNGGRARLLLNRIGQERPWIGLELLGAGARRHVVGATVELHTSNGAPLRRRAFTDGSYASARDPRVLIGLGERDAIETVLVTWPDGARERWDGLPTGVYSTLRQGSGRPAD